VGDGGTDASVTGSPVFEPFDCDAGDVPGLLNLDVWPNGGENFWLIVRHGILDAEMTTSPRDTVNLEETAPRVKV